MGQNRKFSEYVGLYGTWLVFIVLAAWVAFQIRATLVYIGILIVENPRLRPPGWTMNTIIPLERFIILVLGVSWLGLAMYAESYLREGLELRIFWNRLIRLIALVAGLYGFSYLVLVILS